MCFYSLKLRSILLPFQSLHFVCPCFFLFLSLFFSFPFFQLVLFFLSSFFALVFPPFLQTVSAPVTIPFSLCSSPRQPLQADRSPLPHVPPGLRRPLHGRLPGGHSDGGPADPGPLLQPRRRLADGVGLQRRRLLHGV